MAVTTTRSAAWMWCVAVPAAASSEVLLSGWSAALQDLGSVDSDLAQTTVTRLLTALADLLKTAEAALLDSLETALLSLSDVREAATVVRRELAAAWGRLVQMWQAVVARVEAYVGAVTTGVDNPHLGMVGSATRLLTALGGLKSPTLAVERILAAALNAGGPGATVDAVVSAATRELFAQGADEDKEVTAAAVLGTGAELFERMAVNLTATLREAKHSGGDASRLSAATDVWLYVAVAAIGVSLLCLLGIGVLWRRLDQHQQQRSPSSPPGAEEKGWRPTKGVHRRQRSHDDRRQQANEVKAESWF